jgi:diguanylate cyclase (GGDEF)-like protein/PAS domain S-box-containing protein
MDEKPEPIHILLIEDNPGDARLIQEILAEVESPLFNLEHADRLAKGLECLEGGGIDVVLLDLLLPESEGLDTFCQVYAQAPEVPIVVLTILGNETLAIETVKRGGQDYLFKGEVDKNLLVRSIRYGIERKRAEEALRESEERFRTLFDGAPDAIFLTDPKCGEILDVNATASQLLLTPRKDIIGLHYLQLHPSRMEEYSKEAFAQQACQKGRTHFVENVILRADGSEVPVEITAQIVYIEGKPVLQSVFRDITERKQAEERIKYLSLHDFLTGLYNRAYFDEEMRRLNTVRKYPVGVVIADVDNLKLVNDTFGYEKGDEILKRLANILTSTFRKEDVVARIGGDEFAVILPNVDDKTAHSLFQRIVEACQDSNRESPLKLSVSFGYAIQYGQYKDIQETLKIADERMRKDKLVSGTTVEKNVVDFLRVMLDVRDPHIKEHGEEIQDLAVPLGKDIGLPDYKLKDLRLLALFHDIGKIGIPDSILYKPDKLSPEEWETMKRHCVIGYRIAKSIPELACIAEDILYHHEWWNGKGYPEGLKGEDIPLLARIISIVDAYNVLQTDRPYEEAKSKQEAMEVIAQGAGTQFDPKLVDRFLRIVADKDQEDEAEHPRAGVHPAEEMELSVISSPVDASA